MKNVKFYIGGIVTALFLCACGNESAGEIDNAASGADNIASENINQEVIDIDINSNRNQSETSSVSDKSSDSGFTNTIIYEDDNMRIINNSGQDRFGIDEDVLGVYIGQLIYEYNNPRYWTVNLNFGFGDVQGDGIPEMFVLRGTGHPDMVSVYTYDENSGSVYVGDFGGFGRCMYVPGENKIAAQYGNHGYYIITVSSINANNEPELVDTILRNGSNVELKSYYGYDIGDFTGAMPYDDYDINRFPSIGEEYRISEEEADAFEDELYRDRAVSVDYDYCVNVVEGK